MTIKEFVDKRFKNGIHREGIDTYFKVRGVSRKNLGRYIETNFGPDKINLGGFFERMTVEEMDQYMDDLMELMGG